MTLVFTFLWSLCLINIFWAIRVESFHVSKQQNTLFHAFDIPLSWELPRFRRFKTLLSWSSFFLSSELPHFLIQHLDHFAISAGLKPWSFHSKQSLFVQIPGRSRLENCKRAKNAVHLTRIPYRLWSFRTGSSKYVKNQVLFRKHRILRNKIKAPCFAAFPWSSNVNLCIFLRLNIDLHKSMGAVSWDLANGKNRGALNLKCIAWGGDAKMIQWICRGKLSGTQTGCIFLGAWMLI